MTDPTEAGIPGGRPFVQQEQLPIAVQLHRYLRMAIIRGDLKPGQQLSEAEIGKRCSVSRQPVREAFIKLAEERMVMVLPQRGTFVNKVSVSQVLDARFVREVIEVAVAQEAAMKASPSAIDELRQIVAAQGQLPPGSLDEFQTLDDDFHRTLALSVGKEYAWRVIEEVKVQYDRVRYLSLDQASQYPLVVGQHARIIDCVESGDPIAAAAATRTHLREILISLPQIAKRHPEAFEPEV